MRILQVIPALSKGGAEAVVVDLSNSLSEQGHEVTVLIATSVQGESSREGDLLPEVELIHITNDEMGRAGRYLELLRYLFKSRTNLKSYDIIHCHLSFGQFFGSVWRITNILSRNKGPKLVYTCHNVGANVPKRQTYFDHLGARIFDAYVLMAQDEPWIKFASQFKKANLFFIENGISFKLSEGGKDFKDWEERKLTVGTISRLQSERVPWKFVETFVDVARLSPRQFDFVIGGEGPLMSSLKTKSIELGLDDRVEFPGLVTNALEFLEDIDIYLTLNTKSTTGIAGLEAIFRAIPVVAYQSVTDYYDGKNDWIRSSSVTEEVAEEILRIAGDVNYAKETVSRQQTLASTRFTAKTMAQKYSRIYSDQKFARNRVFSKEIHDVPVE